MNRSFLRSVIVFGMLLVLGIVSSVYIIAGSTPKTIRVIYTNDMVGYIEPCG